MNMKDKYHKVINGRVVAINLPKPKKNKEVKNMKPLIVELNKLFKQK